MPTVHPDTGKSPKEPKPTTGGQRDPHPPLDPSKLKSPLSGADRQTVITYLKGHGETQADIVAYCTQNGLPNSPGSWAYITNGSFDDPLIQMYTDVVAGNRIHTPGSGEIQQTTPLSGITDFLDKLVNPNTWLRILEGLIGVVLIGVALAHFTDKSNPVSRLAGMK